MSTGMHSHRLHLDEAGCLFVFDYKEFPFHLDLNLFSNNCVKHSHVFLKSTL